MVNFVPPSWIVPHTTKADTCINFPQKKKIGAVFNQQWQLSKQRFFLKTQILKSRANTTKTRENIAQTTQTELL